MAKKPNRYEKLIEKIFFNHWKEGSNAFEFARDEMTKLAAELNIELPKNLGDILYSFRHRNALPASIISTQPVGLEWIILGAGRARYRFRLARATRIVPSESLMSIAIPDATPEMIRKHTLDDEQALLAILRYNRLIDTFLGLTTYSLQNHLRTAVKDVGQIEIDELYVGLDKYGSHYVIPVQAKVKKDQIGVVQISQDLSFAEWRFPKLRCRPVAAQFMAGNVVALFELALIEDDQAIEVKVVEERHYRLVPAKELDDQKISVYRQ
ncbi:hypothetical protein [Roseococcus sp. YIM B11640]|uniref:hypothetical protein n=1 Tax=Roseococcus sp. YIM B11640 TaxID=3133973 RepID=UPI003C7BBDEB